MFDKNSPNEFLFEAMQYRAYFADTRTYEILYMNSTLVDAIGDHVGELCYKAIHDEDQPCMFCTNSQLIDKDNKPNNQSTVFEFFNEAEDLWYQLQEKAVRWSEDITAKYSIAIDISELKKMQNHLAEAHAELALKNRELEFATKQKSDFLAGMSHEIRTPMNAILGMADLLSEANLDADNNKLVTIIQNAGDNLLNLINDILDLSKVESGQMELEKIEFNLLETIEKACEILALNVHQKNLEMLCDIKPDTPLHLIGDPTRLRQILTNLVGNAAKFTDLGEIAVTVEELNKDKNENSDSTQILFSVKDSGMGIPKQAHDKIFNSFQQVDTSTTRKYGGTGLGLSICRQLVKKMGGNIRIESEQGKGATFFFTCKFGLSQNHNQAPTASMALADMPVLIVDDNRNNRLILTQTLSLWGAKVTDAEDGAAALKALESAENHSNPFKVILLDALMPQMDGFDLAEKIKQRLGRLDHTIIMITSDNTPDQLSRANQIGIPATLAKPVKLQELKTAIEIATSSREKSSIAQSQKIEEDKDQQPLNILLVEDNQDNQTLFIFNLKKSPHTIDVADNGLTGLEKFKSGKYDIVFMDREMPVMDGFEATRKIRQWEQAGSKKAVPIIALTAHAMKGIQEESMAAGCDSFMTKPFKKKQLHAILKEYSPRNA